MNLFIYGMVFLAGGMHLPVSRAAPARINILAQKVISWDLKKHNLFAKNSGNIRNNIKSQIKNKTEVSICGITNTNIKRK